MGGPSHQSEIRDYLKAIFSDPDIMPFPGIFRKPLASYISKKRTPKVAERYSLIGGASPLPGWTEKQRMLVAEAVKNADKDILVAHAFRYTKPDINGAVEELSNKGINEIILLPLFPHYTKANHTVSHVPRKKYH